MAGLGQGVSGGQSPASAFSSATGTRYDSVAQAPKSMSLQRSEQKGRKRLSAVHCTVAPQVGQATVRTFVIVSIAIPGKQSEII
jgi:hypothetical protein